MCGGLPLQRRTAREQREFENRRIQVLVPNEGLFEIPRVKEVWELEVGRGGHLIHYVKWSVEGREGPGG